jgi:hypothetical protein
VMPLCSQAGETREMLAPRLPVPARSLVRLGVVSINRAHRCWTGLAARAQHGVGFLSQGAVCLTRARCRAYTGVSRLVAVHACLSGP